MRVRSLSLVAIPAFVALLISTAWAQQATGTSTLKGKVLTAGGSPAATIAVRLYQEQGPKGIGGGSDGKSAEFLPTPTPLLKGTLVRTIATDKEGKFEAKGLKAGDYTYRAGDPMTVGYRFGKITLEDGKALELEIKLDPPAARK